MSAGNQRVIVRVDPKLLGEIMAAIESRNHHSPDAPHNLSDWIRDAMQRKLDHIKRSKTAARRKAKGHRVKDCAFCTHGIACGDYCYACDMLNYTLDQQ